MLINKDNNGRPIGFIETLILERAGSHRQRNTTGNDRDDARPGQWKSKDGNVLWDLAAYTEGLMCSWLYLASRNSPERFCDRPGHPFCEEHQQEIEYLEKLDWEYEEIERSWESITSVPESRDSSWRPVQRSKIITMRKPSP